MMAGRFGEAPNSEKLPRRYGARECAPLPRPPLHALSPSNQRASLGVSSQLHQRAGAAKLWEGGSADPYLLRVDEAGDQGLVARSSGGADRDSAWSGEHAPPQLRRV